jgi:hypothetical protein
MGKRETREKSLKFRVFRLISRVSRSSFHLFYQDLSVRSLEGETW